MIKSIRDWQQADYVLGFFDKRKTNASRVYRKFVQKGISQGKRPDLTGGGLVRSAGGWTALRALNKETVKVKGDERILRDGDFVEAVLRA